MIEAIDNKNDFVEFRKLFEVVNKKGWVKSLRKGYTGVGYTFECLLNKEEENFPIPDYNSIEIKTTRKSSRHQLHLFTATPDGDFLFPIKRIIEKLGYPDKNDNQHKIFNLGFSGKKFSPIGYYKVGKILVNRNEKKLDFVVYNSNRYQKIDMDISWSFEMLYERLYLKIQNLAYIIADSKFINGEEYFHYVDLKFYKLKNFDTFISLIENGYIYVRFNIGVFRNGKRVGQTHDRGTAFTIEEDSIGKLFDEVSI